MTWNNGMMMDEEDGNDDFICYIDVQICDDLSLIHI